MNLDIIKKINFSKLLSIFKAANNKNVRAVLDITAGKATLLQLEINNPQAIEIAGVDYEPAGEDIAAGIKRLLRRNPLVKDVILSLSSSEVKIYNLSLPALSEFELNEAIKWKVKQIRPFNLNPEDLEYKIINVGQLSKTATSHKVLLTVAPKLSIAQKISWVKEVRCHVSAVTLGAFGLLHFKRFKKIPANEVNIWLFLDSDESFLLVEFGGLPVFIKPLTITADSLAKQISAVMKIDSVQAASLCKQTGLSFWDENKKITDFTQAQESQAKVSFSLASALENLIVEVEHTFKQFSYQVTDLPQYSRVIIAGQVADWKKAKEFFINKFGVLVEKVDLCEHVKQDGCLSLPQWTSGSSLTLSGGLAMQAQSDSLPVNLYIEPLSGLGSISKYINPVSVVVAFSVILLFFGIVNFIGVTGFRISTESLKKEVKLKEQRLNEAQTELMSLAKQEADLTNEKKTLQNKQSFLDGTLHKTKLAVFLSSIASFLPENVSATKIKAEEDKIVLAGNTLDTQKVMKFLDTLRVKGGFSNVQLKYMSKSRKQELYEFEVVITVSQ